MKQPRRPMLPVLLVPLALGWAGIVLASELAYQGLMLPPMIPFAGAALIAVLLVASRRKPPKEPTVKVRLFSLPALAALALFLGLGCGSLFYGHLARQVAQPGGFEGELELVVVEDTRAYAASRGSEALVQRANGSEVRVRIFWNDTDVPLPRGSHVRVTGTFTPLRDDQRWLFDRGCIGTLSIRVIENRGFGTGLWGAIDTFRQGNVDRIQNIGGNGAALLAGVLLGHREALQDTAVEQDFVTCGLTHLIAVSGSHLAVVAALLGWFLRRLPLHRVVEITLLLLVLALYVMLTGLQPSAIRSAIMAGAAGCSTFIGRRGHAPSALAAAALIMLLVCPTNASSLGFWLSVCAVMGITLFANLVAQWLATAALLRARQGRKSPGAPAQALALTITAMASTLPLSVPAFAVLSLVGPLANLLAAPLISLVLVCGMVALVVIPLFEPLGALLLSAAAFVSDICTWLAALFVRLPWASVPLEVPLPVAAAVGIAAAALVYFTWPVPRAGTLRFAATGALAVVFVLAQVLPLLSAPRLVAMDVGQGDALLIQEQRNAILIDTGASDAALVHALARNNIRSLRAVIITHLDSDHAAALGRLRGLVPVERVYFARGLLENQRNHEYIREACEVVGAEQVRELSQGQSLRLGPTLSLVVVWPERTALEGSNEESICVLLQYDADANGIPEQQALLTGDAEQDELAAILRHSPSLQAQVIKVGHHGSRDAVTSGQLEELGATVALISVGAHNRYGHPTQETLDALAQAGVMIFRTDEQGDITCFFKGNTLEFSCATMSGEFY